jgi:hypothetical protein
MSRGFATGKGDEHPANVAIACTIEDGHADRSRQSAMGAKKTIPKKYFLVDRIFDFR